MGTALWGFWAGGAAGRRASLGTIPTAADACTCRCGLAAVLVVMAARRTDVGTKAVTVLSMSARGILTTVDAAEIVASFFAVIVPASAEIAHHQHQSAEHVLQPCIIV